MTIYITQGRYTHDAIKGMTAKAEDRTEAVRALFTKLGGKLIAFYLTFGEYDFIIIAEAHDEKTVATAVLAAAAAGGVTDLRTTVALNWTDAKAAFEAAGKLAGSFQTAGGAR